MKEKRKKERANVKERERERKRRNGQEKREKEMQTNRERNRIEKEKERQKEKLKWQRYSNIRNHYFYWRKGMDTALLIILNIKPQNHRVERVDMVSNHGINTRALKG